MKHRIILIIAFLIPALTAFNQTPRVTKLDGSRIHVFTIDSIVTSLMEKAGVTGLNLCIINNNKPAYVKSYGFKNKEKTERIDTSTIFYAASYSKSVFAYLVMILVQEGKLDPDKPIYQYLPKPLPEYVDYKDLAGDDRWKLITARHCLSHTTGFPNWRFLNPKGNRKLEFFFTPGTRYAYSGEGLVLLQLVIEAITGRGLEELMQEKVFQPIGMYRTSYVWQPSFDQNHAVGFNEDDAPIDIKKRNNANAAGSMVTTISDYSKFVSAVMQGKGLTKASLQEMTSSQVRIRSKGQFPSLRTDTTTDNDKIQLSYGLGWGVLTSNYGPAFFKEGHDDGWEHYNINFPQKQTGIIIMTNSSNGESIFKELLDKLIGDTFTPWKWEGYTPYRTIAVIDTATLHEYTGLYKQEGVNVTISLENGILKLNSKEGGLSNVKLYPESKDRFFTRTADITLEFIRDTNNKVLKIKAAVGEETYEFTKSN